MRDKWLAFAEKLPALFWLLTGGGFYLIYRIPAVLLGKENPGSQALLLAVLSLAAVVYMMLLYGKWDFGFAGDSFVPGFSMGWLLLLPVLGEFLVSLCIDPIRPWLLVQLLLYSAAGAAFETILLRSILLGHMMRIWKGIEYRGLMASVTAGLIGGLLPLVNLCLGKGGAEVMIECLEVFALSCALGAIYVRTRDFWPVAAVFALHLFASRLFQVYEPGESGILSHAISSHAFLLILDLGSSLCILLIGLGLMFFLVYWQKDEGEDERWPEARFDPVPEMDDQGNLYWPEDAEGEENREDSVPDLEEESEPEKSSEEEEAAEEDGKSGKWSW